MNYLSLEDIKRQCRIDASWTEDDDLLEGLGDAAESFTEAHLNNSLEEITAQNSGELPSSIYRAMLLLVSYYYDNDGSGDQRPLPQAYFIMVKPWQKYTFS